MELSMENPMAITGKILDIKHFAVHDGDGIRTTVFLKGCPLACVWCHNPEGLSFSPELSYVAKKCIACGECAEVCPSGAQRMGENGHILDRAKCLGCGKCEEVCLGGALRLYGKTVSVGELLPTLLEDRSFYEHSGGGVTLSGGEALMQPAFCTAMLQALKAQGISTAVDTCGFVKKRVLDAVIPYTDCFLYDIKAVDDAVHRRCTGQSNRKILENLRYLDDCGQRIEVRYPYVPMWNAGEAEAIAELLLTVRHLVGVRVLPYHNLAGSKYEAIGRKNTLPAVDMPSAEETERVRQLFHDRGLPVRD